MKKITESQIEQFTIDLFEKQGYQYIYAPSIAPDSDTPERQSFEDVLLIERLQSAVGMAVKEWFNLVNGKINTEPKSKLIRSYTEHRRK